MSPLFNLSPVKSGNWCVSKCETRVDLMSFDSTAPSFHQKQHVIVGFLQPVSFPYHSHTSRNSSGSGISSGVSHYLGSLKFPLDVTWDTRCLSQDAGVTTRMTLHF